MRWRKREGLPNTIRVIQRNDRVVIPTTLEAVLAMGLNKHIFNPPAPQSVNKRATHMPGPVSDHSSTDMATLHRGMINLRYIGSGSEDFKILL